MVAAVKDNLEQIKTLCKQHHVKRLYLFGSAYSGKLSAKSDVDFLYEMNHRSFAENYYLDYANEIFELGAALKNLLSREIDLVRKDLKKPNLFHIAIGDQYQMIYEE